MNLVFAGIIGYILLQLLIGIVVSRSIRTEDDYLLAGRKLGFGLATFSIFATWFGAESCIGTAGAAYDHGLSGVTADPFGYTVCLFIMGAFLAIPLWKKKLTTVADLYRQRFSVTAERISAAIMIPTSLLWAAAQIRAFGQVLTASSELDLTVAITLAALVVVVYTSMGGLLADAMTDLLQGAVLMVGLLILLPAVLAAVGGPAAFLGFIAPEKLSLHSGGTDARSLLQTMEAWAVPVCGSVVAQELVSRVLASRSPQVARSSSFVAAFLYLGMGLIPVLIGLAGSSMMPGLVHAEQVLPLVAQQHLSDFFYIVFAGALVSAILSTVDSALLAASALASHNLISSMRLGMTESSKVLMGRAGVILMGILAYVLALHAEGVYNLVREASSFGSAGIFVALIFGLFTSFGGTKSAVSALVTGAVVWCIGHYGFRFEMSYLLALAASLTAYVTFAMSERRAVRPDVQDAGQRA